MGQVLAVDNPKIDFRTQIRPILSDKCYACHGPDAGQRQTELRLDTQEGAFADLGGYVAVAPGDLESSDLVQRILSDDEDIVMPPADHLKSLTEAEKQALVAWVEQGASWSEHWSYVVPEMQRVPEVEAVDWPQNWIDNFVLANLEKRGIQPSGPAEKRTLIRRLSFDLTGLPPSQKEVSDFLEDSSGEAYERVVDRLLQSPHYGERMAMYWLDLVRYADTVGYHGDQDVSVSPFRDYVIDAFNKNLPFDRFTREQLAGDLLENPTTDQMIASGYNKLGMMSAEGGVQPEEYLVKYASDRVRTASTVWLGMTLGCAECHDHKFDPMTAKDFYRFAAFFSDIKERGLYSGANRDGKWGPTIDVPDVQLPVLLEGIDQQILDLTQQLESPSDDVQRELAEAQIAWEPEIQKRLSAWKPLLPESATADHDTVLTVRDDSSLLASGANPGQNQYRVVCALPETILTGLCVEVLPDASLPKSGPGRAGNGNFVITEVRAFLENADGDRKPIPLNRARASIEQADGAKNPYAKWAAEAAIDGDVKGATWGWAILPQAGKTSFLTIGFTEAVQAASTDRLVIEIDQNHTNPTHTLGCFRLHHTPRENATQLDFPGTVPEPIQTVLGKDPEDRSQEDRQTLSAYYQTIAPRLDAIRQQLVALKTQRESLIASHTRTTLITVATTPREIRILERGDWMDRKGEVVQPGVPHFLEQIPADDGSRASRLDLANWLTDRQNPLTARVFVNRLWTLMFGVGISKVLDDVGSQGEPPVLPELLDALAIEFMDSGWDVKHILKRMVMSNAYRQSSYGREDLREIDPFNRLVARQSRFRLDAEMVRDNALKVSGLLVPQIGGRSAKPYQPAGLYQHLNFPAREYQPDTDQNQYRRGVYTHWQRQFLHPALQAMDAPAREECTAQRSRSNTPLAALVLLNDPSYVESARKLAEHAIEFGGDSVDERLEWLSQQTISRSFNAAERKVFHELLEKHLKAYTEAPQDAEQVLTIGMSGSDSAIPKAELAAWTSLARVLLNMHETITRN